MLPMPTVSLDLDASTFLEEFKDIGEVVSGVGSFGDAAAYALVWEFGNMRQTKKGPKTTLGINLTTGEQVWLSIQAPTGYVRVNEEKYWAIIKKRLRDLTLSGTTKEEIREELEETAHLIAQDVAEVIREAAPEDKGGLKASILAISPGSDILYDDEYDDVALQVEAL